MYDRGRCWEISDERERQGIWSVADLYSLYKVVLIGGTYVRSWSASSGES